MSSAAPIKIYKTQIKDGSLKPDPAQEHAVQSLQRLFEDLQNIEPKKRKKLFSKAIDAPKGVYLYGGVGRGKSMLMDMFFEALPQTLPASRVHFHEFMIGVHDYIHSRREADGIREGVDATLPLLAARISEKSRVLCFDEFHVTDVADAMILGRLFRCLFELGVVVVATSNWPPDRLYEGGLQRDRFLPFIALIKEKLEIVYLDSPTDYRTEFIAQEGSYFSPLGKESAMHADRLFEKLTGQPVAGEEHITVKGREILVHASRGVARFTFAQLCEQPHGAEDYLKIAQTYHTVFLENVPKLGYDRRNEAKRLMILIDALYEAKTRLIITAETTPDKLYRGHDHAFEFDRTISRLNEMQSADYLKKS
jgi:cell division protein ZapE